MRRGKRQPAKPSSPRGTKEFKSPPPLRFETVKDAKRHIRANKMKVKEHHSNSRGVRIQVLLPNGKARTLTVNTKPDADRN